MDPAADNVRGTVEDRAGTDLSPAERAYIRRELAGFFGTRPSVAEGFLVKTRRTGAGAGAPKLPPAGQTLLARGLVRLAADGPWHRLYFTPDGLAALRAMLAAPRGRDREDLAHARRELGLPE